MHQDTSAHDILHRTFGYSSFREHQLNAIQTVMAGKDAFVLMPTGMGKSICYQIPAMLLDGVAVVVSPLIALMQDQVNALRLNGVQADFLNSSLTRKEAYETRSRLVGGKTDLLYVAPERLLVPSFQEMLQTVPVALFAVDEAHCVSQWGHDFRPEYLRIPEVMALFDRVPRMALTATADAQTRKDILGRLSLRSPASFVSSFDRPNIRYRVNLKEKGRRQLLSFIEQEHPGRSGIVYVRTRKRADQIAAWLEEKGIFALPYHAGLDQDTRALHQKRFIAEEGVVMVATIAFGMGIDKPDVRFVAHLDLPSSMEAYYQETGRAGRDGEPADAWMVYSLADLISMRRILEASSAEEAFKHIQRRKLDSLLGYCETAECRRKVLLRYFGEDFPKDCSNCDTCLQPPDTWDGTVAAQKALSCVYRTGQRFGAGHLADVLTANATARIEKFGHDRIKTFGVGREMTRQDWFSVYRQLLAGGLLTVGESAISGFRLTPRSRPVLKGEKSIRFRKDPEKDRILSKKRKKPVKASLDLATDRQRHIFEHLRSLRLELASSLQLPPYLIFHDKTLKDMAVLQPKTLEELLTVTGVGEKKAEKYGERFLAAIAEAGIDFSPSR